MRILLVEDDVMIGEAVQDTLREAACAVDWVTRGEDALHALECQSYDLMLLDLGLPGKDGLEVLRRVREQENAIPVLVMTARHGVEDRILGLDSGADDYILKPFVLSELMARIRAVMRRNAGRGVPLLSNGVLELSLLTRQVAVNGGPPQALSNREYALLNTLLMRPGAIFSRAELEEHIYGWGEEVESNAVEYLIHALRKKLGSHAIKNVRGVGWFVSGHP